MRVLVLSHGHPEFGAGGAERAAYSVFQRLKTDPSVDRAVFVARAERRQIGHDAFFGSFRGRADEILASPPPVDGFSYQSLNPDLLKQLIDELLKAVRPDVVHIHHFLFWGLDVLEMFKNAGVRVILTFHEYAAICVNLGQMVKTSKHLCHSASPAECGQCFPAVSAGKFFVRESIAKMFLSHVDMFISPSEFLKQRYVAWGLPAERIEVIENVMDQDVLRRSQLPSAGGGRVRTERQRLVLGFFGQINPYKGVDVLLQACASLPKRARKRLEVRIHGENKHFREGEFGERIERLTTETTDVVRMMGGNRNQDVVGLMKACDWIVIPSIWWENSPIVIQEARLAGRPMICADIGGMAEKTDPSVDITFQAGSSGALSDIMQALAEGASAAEPSILSALAESRGAVDTANYQRHVALYRGGAGQMTLRNVADASNSSAPPVSIKRSRRAPTA